MESEVMSYASILVSSRCDLMRCTSDGLGDRGVTVPHIVTVLHFRFWLHPVPLITHVH